MTAKLRHYLEGTRPPTPVLFVDLDCVEQKYLAMREAFPGASIHYAVNANPAPEVLARLAAQGCHFDVASAAEMRCVFDAEASPDHISFGNTVKKEADIAEAAAAGVRLFAVDAEAEVCKVARSAPGSRVFCRILIESAGAKWPLSRKFGCAPERAVEVLRCAAARGLVPYGVSFHVGSQRTDPGQWDTPINICHRIFEWLEQDGIQLQMLNIGGGFPATYRPTVPPLAAYARQIHCSLMMHFDSSQPRLIVESGRGLVGGAPDDCSFQGSGQLNARNKS